MKIRVISGTNQIGGCITEITTKKAKIIIDFGEELTNDDSKKVKDDINLEGLTFGTPKYDGVLITHSHSDHIGLIDKVLPEIDVYVEEESQKIYEISGDFCNKKTRKNVKKVEFKKSFNIKDIKITYYRIDHSAFNSAVILLEAEGKRILHTGDFRRNGRKGDEFESTIRKIGQVDYLITEGTCLSRKAKENETEFELEKKLIPIFKKYNQVFVLQSSTNIDRIVSIYRASIATKKVFIEDLCTANIALELGKKYNIPNINFKPNSIFVWKPIRKKYYLDYNKYYEPLKHRCVSSAVYGDYCMLVKSSMYADIKMLHDKGYASNAILIYSMWDGYLKQKKIKDFVDNLKKLGIDYKKLHVSGHADIKTLKIMHKLTKPRKGTIVIHTNNKAKAEEIFDNYLKVKDKKEIKI